MTKPLWQALCDLWVAEQRGITGLTVPFLVAATQLPNITEAEAALDQADLANLLYELQSQCPANRSVRIEMCGVPRKPVVKVSELNEVQSHKELVMAKKGNSRLYVSQTYAHDRTMNSVVQAIWNVVGDAIASGAYSYDNGRYRSLTLDEKTFIKQAWHEFGMKR